MPWRFGHSCCYNCLVFASYIVLRIFFAAILGKECGFVTSLMNKLMSQTEKSLWRVNSLNMLKRIKYGCFDHVSSHFCHIHLILKKHSIVIWIMQFLFLVNMTEFAIVCNTIENTTYFSWMIDLCIVSMISVRDNRTLKPFHQFIDHIRYLHKIITTSWHAPVPPPPQ